MYEIHVYVASYILRFTKLRNRLNFCKVHLMKIADGFHCFSLFISGNQRLHHVSLPLVAIDTIDYKTNKEV